MPSSSHTLNTELLPRWDLKDLYPAMDSEKLHQDYAMLEDISKEFAEHYKGRVAELKASTMLEAVKTYERMQELIGRIYSYAGLLHAQDMTDGKISQFYQTAQEKLNRIGTTILFFTLEINRLADDTLENWFQESAALARYKPWFETIRQYRPYQLSDDLEQLLHEKSVTGRAAWNRLFDETMAALQFDFKDPESGVVQQLGLEACLDHLSSRDGAARKAAAEALHTTFDQNIRLFTLITSTLAKDKEIEDRWRNYETPATERHLSNRVEQEVVDALVHAVKDAYPKLSHRYYALKAQWFGRDKLDWWDRNAPLPGDDDRLYQWDEATTIVLDAYGRFSPQLAEIGRTFFDNAWIDAPVRPGKAPGAFAHPTVPAVHPYLLLNYLGKSRDVMTLAHELGHGVHQVLAAPQGELLAATPLTLAETASVFGEMLTFQSLLDQEQDDKRRKRLMAGKVEDMLNTVIRQIAFYDFEIRVHTARKDKELSADDLSEIWMAVQKESLGEAFHFDDAYRHFWCYIPHFIHSPFYVYAYAFGDCLVNSLYATYLEHPEGFEAKYIDMLKAGGSKHHRELLAPFGLDASDPAFWSTGLNMISDYIDQLQ
tara:strand:- start:173 stop:1972 length:1800 start_codon:yes stop_codon:yes gene_type:complete